MMSIKDFATYLPYLGSRQKTESRILRQNRKLGNAVLLLVRVSATSFFTPQR